MPTIKVDQRVLDALAVKGGFGDTYNDVLCDLLDLPRGPQPQVNRKGKLYPLVLAGLLYDGQSIEWHRRNIGQTFTAVITSDGCMRTSDGRTFVTPDICASTPAGYPCKGWAVGRPPTASHCRLSVYGCSRRTRREPQWPSNS